MSTGRLAQVGVGQKLTRILVALKHQLAGPGIWIPELHASIFGTTQHPITIWCKGNAQDKVLVPFKRSRAPSPSSHLATNHVAVSGHQLPHFDSLVQTSTDQAVAVGRESDAVDAVGMAIGSFQSTNQVASRHTPDTDALVQRSSCDKVSARRDGDGGDPIFNLEGQNFTIAFDIPDADGMVAAAGGNVTAVTREVQRVDVLLVACKGVTDGTTLDIPDLELTSRSVIWHRNTLCVDCVETYPDDLILRPCSKIDAIWTEADTSDIQIAVFFDFIVQ